MECFNEVIFNRVSFIRVIFFFRFYFYFGVFFQLINLIKYFIIIKINRKFYGIIVFGLLFYLYIVEYFMFLYNINYDKMGSKKGLLYIYKNEFRFYLVNRCKIY